MERKAVHVRAHSKELETGYPRTYLQSQASFNETLFPRFPEPPKIMSLPEEQDPNTRNIKQYINLKANVFILSLSNVYFIL